MLSFIFNLVFLFIYLIKIGFQCIFKELENFLKKQIKLEKKNLKIKFKLVFL